MDLETYRLQTRSRRRDGPLTYRELGERLGLAEPVSRLRRIALGLVWPAPETIEAIVRGSGGAVTVEAMHRRRLAARQRSSASVCLNGRGAPV